MTREADDKPIRVEQLSESYRFDDELARLLTEFQYHQDGITLTAAEPRPLPSKSYSAPTEGLEAVFGSTASLVFVCYDDRGYQMVNPIEARLVESISSAITTVSPIARPDGGAAAPLAEGPAEIPDSSSDGRDGQSEDGLYTDADDSPSLGVVTPHNAQRGVLEGILPEEVTTNTVEKYQGGERDIIAVCGTVSDPEFARSEERFILNPQRLLVAISRSRLLTVVVCSTSLFEVAPEDSERLDHGPVWARLFTKAVGQASDPVWSGSLDQFVDADLDEYATVPVSVYPSCTK